MSAAKQRPSRERFDALRARYLTAKAKLDDVNAAHEAKYGPGCQESWLKPGERTAYRKAKDAAERAGEAFTDYVAAISPRDWSRGVPFHWVRESLTYEDATRPLGEVLSVSPPLAWGASAPRV